MKRLLLSSLTVLPFLTMAPLKADITPVVEYSSTSTLTDDRPFTLGYEFNLSTSYDVTALGYWVDGLGFNHPVGIWNASGTLLASTFVLSTDPVIGHFQYQTIPTLTLNPGDYVIGGQLSGSDGADEPFPNEAQGITSQPGYTYIEDRQSFGAGLNFPDSSFGTYGGNGILAVDFAGDASAVPEPAEMLPVLILMGGLCLAFGIRRKARRSPAAV